MQGRECLRPAPDTASCPAPNTTRIKNDNSRTPVKPKCGLVDTETRSPTRAICGRAASGSHPPPASHLDFGHELDALKCLQPLDAAFRAISGLVDATKGCLLGRDSRVIYAVQPC